MASDLVEKVKCPRIQADVFISRPEDAEMIVHPEQVRVQCENFYLSTVGDKGYFCTTMSKGECLYRRQFLPVPEQ